MKSRFLLLAIVLATSWAGVAASQTTPPTKEPRVALVIGNANYPVSPLLNPANDAAAVAAILKENGFQVTHRENVGRKEMHVLLRKFGERLRKGGVGLFFFAGHGMQIKGRNYLIPVDGDIKREDEVEYNALDANAVLAKMESAKNRMNIVILDACRNNPFARSFRSGAMGLAQMDAPLGTLVAFATAPGSVASDGAGTHGLYTQHLLDAMKVPGAKLEDVFKQVRMNVRRDSQGKQIPWESTSLEGDFYFKAALPAPSVQSPAVGSRSADAASAELAPIKSIDSFALKKGDQWTHQVIDLFSGSIQATIPRTVKAIADGKVDLIDAKGVTRAITDLDLNLITQFNPDGSVDRQYSKARPYGKLPLKPGDKWKDEYVLTRPNRLTSNISVEFRATRQERVVTPAGVFNTLRVDGHSKFQSIDTNGKKGAGGSTLRFWLSPVVGNFVAFEYEEVNAEGKRTRSERTELVSYKRTASP